MRYNSRKILIYKDFELYVEKFEKLLTEKEKNVKINNCNPLSQGT